MQTIKILNVQTAVQKLVLCCCMLTGLISCQRFLDIDPPKTEIITESVFSSDRSATSAITGIYSQMMTGNNFTALDLGFVTALSSDEVNVFNTLNATHLQFQNNALLASNTTVKSSLWEPAYKYIWYANAALEGLERSSDVSAVTKNQLQGEAKFIRAFCHFYLTNLYGDIAVITRTDYRVNSIMPKTAQAKVYEQIIADLLDAQTKLTDEYPTNGRVRPNRGAATALLARTYLYTQNWTGAETEASKVIGDSKYTLEIDLNNVFLAASREAIWQLMPVVAGQNTTDAKWYASNAGGQTLTMELIGSFEPGDKRISNWIKMALWPVEPDTTYAPFKYKVSESNKPVTEYNMVLRLAEQYLIRAEARAHQNKLVGDNSAASDLNAVRFRAGLAASTAQTQAALLDAIQQERRVELFTEFGHRWFDLKRTGNANQVLAPLKSDWQPTDVLYPIPETELESNKNLLPQNNGY